MDNPVRPVEGQTPGVCAADADGRGSRRDLLDDVRPRADAGVEQHQYLAGRLHTAGSNVEASDATSGGRASRDRNTGSVKSLARQFPRNCGKLDRTRSLGRRLRPLVSAAHLDLGVDDIGPCGDRLPLRLGHAARELGDDAPEAVRVDLVLILAGNTSSHLVRIPVATPIVADLSRSRTSRRVGRGHKPGPAACPSCRRRLRCSSPIRPWMPSTGRRRALRA